jgi:peptide/nickel transport system substrate-binding protein
VLALLAAGCGVKSGDAKTGSAGGPVANVRIGMVKPHQGFNVLSGNGALSFMNYNNFVLAQLVEKDENGHLVPSIFRSWDISKDNTVLEVTIPTNVKWHDGKPLTAEDIQFSLEYGRDVLKKNNLKQLKAVEILSESKLRLIFSEPAAYGFLYNLFTMTTYAIPKHIWKDIDNPTNYQGKENTIGCGPYRFVSYDEAAQTSHYEAVENYYKGELKVKSVDIRSFETQESLVMALVNGEIDMVYNYSVPVDPSFSKMLTQAKDINIGEGPFPGNEFLSFGMSNKACQDLEFRKAVSYAVDYRVTAMAIGGDFGEIPGKGIIPPGNKGFDETIARLEYNPEKARSIFEAAGYKDKNGDGLREYPDGSTLALKITPYVGQSTIALRSRLCEVIAEGLKAVGINAAIDEEATRNFDFSYQKTFKSKTMTSMSEGDPGHSSFQYCRLLFRGYGKRFGRRNLQDPSMLGYLRGSFPSQAMKNMSSA